MLKLSALLLLASSVSAYAQSDQGGFGIVNCPNGSTVAGCLQIVPSPQPIPKPPVMLNGRPVQVFDEKATAPYGNAQATQGAAIKMMNQSNGP